MARSEGLCELCSTLPAAQGYVVSGRNGDTDAETVAVCETCLQAIESGDTGEHWRCLEGSIWSPEPAVQALSYRLLSLCRPSEWAADILSSTEPEEDIQRWAMSAFELADEHRDAFGNKLENGDTIVLTQALNVKGTSFSAAKGTVVKKIRLVPSDTGQIEGKINDQTIVILTKYVKKN